MVQDSVSGVEDLMGDILVGLGERAALALLAHCPP